MACALFLQSPIFCFLSLFIITRLDSFMIETYALVLATLMVNEYFGVGVVSAAMDGGAPALNPGWVRRRINTHPEVRHALSIFALYK